MVKVLCYKSEGADSGPLQAYNGTALPFIKISASMLMTLVSEFSTHFSSKLSFAMEQ